MFQIGDHVVYKREVCKIKDIKKNKFSNKDYYILVPINDESLIIDVPVENPLGYLRNIMSKAQVEDLIQRIPEIKEIDNINERFIENEYKQLLQSCRHEDLIRIIKTTYLRNDVRKNQGKKIGEKDHVYFELAEKYLYSEFSIALDLSFEETKNYVFDQVSKIVDS